MTDIKLESQIERLKNRAKILKEKQRKARTRKMIELGALVEKAGISDLDSPTLLGAFQELKQKSSQKHVVEEWKKTGESLLVLSIQESLKPLILTLGQEPGPEDRAALKTLKFKWNPFRKEWHGMGIYNEIQEKFKHLSPHIEQVNDF